MPNLDEMLDKKTGILEMNLSELAFLKYYCDLVSKNYGLKELKETNEHGYSAVKKVNKLYKKIKSDQLKMINTVQKLQEVCNG